MSLTKALDQISSFAISEFGGLNDDDDDADKTGKEDTHRHTFFGSLVWDEMRLQ